MNNPSHHVRRVVLLFCCAFSPACSSAATESTDDSGIDPTDTSVEAGDAAREDSAATADGSKDADGATGADAADADVASDTRDGGVVDGGDAGACAPFVPDAKLAASRAACTFTTGAKVAATVESGAAARAAITHVIILTHENRSFDHMYGTMGGDFEGFPKTYTNPKPGGGTAAPFHLTTACPPDIDHSTASITAEWDGGKMDGFYATDGAGALGYYDPADHPFYTWLSRTFAASDHYFCSTMGNTGLNRRFLYGASATATANNIFVEMNAAGVTWGDYFNGTTPIYNTYTFPAGDAHLHPYSQFLGDLDAGKLPSVTFLDTPSDEHPAGSMHDGERIVSDIVSHAFKSPLWPHLLLILNYDEGGGFFDHMPPPAACKPSTSAADTAYDRQGFRVPLVLVSPFARGGYVSHLDHSHTSVLRLIELLHDLPAITARDANSDALLDMLDFACPKLGTPPTAVAPSPGGC